MLKFNHSTKLQLAQRLRAIYKDPSTPRWKIILIAKYLNTLILNGDVTDAQIKAVFDGLTNPQLAALKTKLSDQSVIYDNVMSSQGQ
jgi:hypothetical protein